MTLRDDSTPAPTEGPHLPGLLVDPAWLEERLGDPGLRVVDLREGNAYRSGHVPGAVRLDLSDLGSTVAGRDNVLVPPDEFDILMAERGISDEDAVVAYDDQWGLAAARLTWALHYYGHERAAVLNGGWDRWRDEGRGTTSEEDGEGLHGAGSSDEDSRVRVSRGHSAPVRFEATPRPDVYADTEWIARRIESGDAVLLDVRTPGEFEKGHLPGAVSWDWFNAVPAGSWDVTREPRELREEWRALGLGPTEDITVYCRSGMRAAHTWLAMRNAGFERVRLYDGSWQEWSETMEGADGE